MGLSAGFVYLACIDYDMKWHSRLEPQAIFVLESEAQSWIDEQRARFPEQRIHSEILKLPLILNKDQK